MKNTKVGPLSKTIQKPKKKKIKFNTHKWITNSQIQICLADLMHSKFKFKLKKNRNRILIRMMERPLIESGGAHIRNMASF